MKFNFKPIVQRLTNDKVTRLGRGEFAVAYRSNTDPSIVYIVANNNDAAKELIRHVDTEHSPKMQWIADFSYYSEDYNIYKTEYTECPNKNHGRAYDQYMMLQTVWNESYISRVMNTKRSMWYAICDDFIDELRDNQLVDESIIHTLECISSWSSAYGPNYIFEFPRCNLGVDSNGNLVLRDIVFFRPLRKGDY